MVFPAQSYKKFLLTLWPEMRFSLRHILRLIAAVVLWAAVASCSSTRHVSDGSLLLDKVDIEVKDDSLKDFDEDQMMLYLRQQPNHKIFWSAKMQLGIYNMSGNDSTKWYNKFLRKMGEPPVIFDSVLTDLSAAQLHTVMVNKGYLKGEVEVDTIARRDKKKMEVRYTMLPGEPYKVRSIDWQYADDSIGALIESRKERTLLREGMNLDRNLLEAERERITNLLRNRGYYAFDKEFISFVADTTAGSRDVDLTLVVNPPYDKSTGHSLGIDTHSPYFIRDIKVVANYDPAKMPELRRISTPDSVFYGDIEIFYGADRYLRPSVIVDNVFFRSGQLFRTRDVNRTYQAFARLGILKFINVQLVPVAHADGKNWLDAYILLTPGKPQSIELELEGTNSEGDLGVAAGITYSHNNIGHGSETFTAKLRGAYESLSGNLDGLIHDRYMEYSLDLGLSFPKFKAPFLSSDFKKRVPASTEFNISMNYQERPEYTRIIAGAGWTYKWSDTHHRHRFSPIDINYVYLPESTNSFLDQIAPDNPLLRYSYEDHFIMAMAYHYYYTTKRRRINQWRERFQPNVSTLRVGVETAGNLLYAINSIVTHRDDAQENPYKVFGIRYSQYVKGEAEYAFTHTFDMRNSLAFRAGVGIAYPYGNSRILPFEKRFYGGGANGVRGWDVRTLGPGCYDSSSDVSSFINQCGDINLILSLEYRAKLFWFFEGALFVDAGNIWTIHNYENQPGGMFHFNSFLEQMAMSYGVGLRLNFNYFLIRIDLGMKAHNPAKNGERWPIVNPKWGRDRSLHFSIGYPF